MNKLPFRKVFSTVDSGSTKGPKTLSGEIGAGLEFDPKDKAIITFTPMPGKVTDVTEDVRQELSSDQLYFPRACLAVQIGYYNSSDILFLQQAQPRNLY